MDKRLKEQKDDFCLIIIFDHTHTIRASKVNAVLKRVPGTDVYGISVRLICT